MKSMWTLSLALLMAVGLLAATPEPSPSPSPSEPPPTATPSPNPQVTARAKEWFHRLQTGKIDLSQVDDVVAKRLSDPKTIKEVTTEFGSLGDPVTFEQVQTVQKDGISYYIYLVTFGGGQKFNFLFALDAQGKVAGLRLAAAQ